MKILFNLAGFASLGFGIIGMFLPLIPTVPLILAAAYFFAKGSDNFYNWLIEHKVFGKYIRDYKSGSGIPKHAKIKAILLVWTSITISIIIVKIQVVQILLLLISLVLTYYLFSLPTKESDKQ
jgi:hypothetical protein